MRRNLIQILYFANFIFLLLFLSCSDNSISNNSGSTNPKGPLNPSFEDTDPVTGTAHWIGVYGRLSGTGVMPTNGQYYINCGSIYSFYQDNVDFSNSTKLIFDWQYHGNTSQGGDFYWLFTANGTDTLCHRHSITPLVLVQNDTITLPSLPTKGRLTFTNNGYIYGSFDIDNIRTR